MTSHKAIQQAADQVEAAAVAILSATPPVLTDDAMYQALSKAVTDYRIIKGKKALQKMTHAYQADKLAASDRKC